MLVLLVMFDLLTSSNADIFSLVVPDGSISGQLGSSVVLPCALSPSLDCKGFEISWYRQNDEDNPILVYRDLKVQENAGHPQYRGRVSLVGDLQKGNVSLKLENLTLADRGEYVCFVDSSKWYEKASVFFTIPVVGSPPLLTLAEDGDQVNITCESGGWSPNTTLIWRDKGGRELRSSVDHYTVDSEGLVSVSSWLMFSPSGSERISCSVGLSDQEMREGRVLLLKPASATRQPGVSPGWIAFIIVLVINLLVISLLVIPKIRGHILPKRQNATPTEEEAHPFVGEAVPPPCPVSTVREISRADGSTHTSGLGPPSSPVCSVREINRADGSTQNSAEFIPPSSPVSALREVNRADGATQTSGEFNPPPCPVCSVRETNTADRATQTSGEFSSSSSSASALREITRTDAATQTSEKRAKESNEEENADWEKMLECRVALKLDQPDPRLGVLCKERMQSGQYYWEVTGLTGSLAPAPALSKSILYECPKSWYVGVVSETVMKRQPPLTPENGCWVLHYDKDREYYVNDPSLIQVLVRDRFSKLGVFLDCEKHTLSFYDKQSHLYTFHNVDSTQPLVPVVFPGLKPRYSLEISNA